MKRTSFPAMLSPPYALPARGDSSLLLALRISFARWVLSNTPHTAYGGGQAESRRRTAVDAIQQRFSLLLDIGFGRFAGRVRIASGTPDRLRIASES
jgi:hypothetical protein